MAVLSGGDWNVHVAQGETLPLIVGERGLSTATTMGGQVLRQPLAAHQCLLDSFSAIKYRGNWRHNV